MSDHLVENMRVTEHFPQVRQYDVHMFNSLGRPKGMGYKPVFTWTHGVPVEDKALDQLKNLAVALDASGKGYDQGYSPGGYEEWVRARRFHMDVLQTRD